MEEDMIECPRCHADAFRVELGGPYQFECPVCGWCGSDEDDLGDD